MPAGEKRPAAEGSVPNPKRTNDSPGEGEVEMRRKVKADVTDVHASNIDHLAGIGNLQLVHDRTTKNHVIHVDAAVAAANTYAELAIPWARNLKPSHTLLNGSSWEFSKLGNLPKTYVRLPF